MMTEDKQREIREQFRADLEAMDAGTYTPPLPDPTLFTFHPWPDAPAPKRSAK